jgi:hypothetical protein
MPVTVVGAIGLGAAAKEGSASSSSSDDSRCKVS